MPTESELRQTISELTNIIGVNVKTLVSSDGTFLSLPVVIEGRNYSVQVRDSRIVARKDFLTEGEPVAVTVLEAAVPA
jgi:CheY-specific phosphatase CheX